MKLSFDQNATGSMAACFGITDERVLEISNAIDEEVDKINETVDIEGKGWSPAGVLQAVSPIPQTADEVFFVGYVVGSYIEINQVRRNPLEKLFSALAQS